jgi:ATP-dependent Lhr-like helicase
VLVTAPTGSGKTLAAFLWALNRLITGKWTGGRVRVLYVSPLKALNNDIERNLLAPLAALEEVFERWGRFPRSGLRPEAANAPAPGSMLAGLRILITTPRA